MFQKKLKSTLFLRLVLHVAIRQYKENDKKYEAWFNKKNTIKAELNNAKKQFLEPQVQEYKRLHPVPTGQKNNF